MQRKNSRKLILLVVLLGLIVCLLTTWFAAGFVLGWPGMMEDLGSPSPALDDLERVYLTLYLVVNRQALASPAGDPGQSLEIIVEQGDTASAVVGRLQAVGLVADGRLLENYLRYRGIDRAIEVGRYPLSGSMTIRELADNLQSAQTLDIRVTIPEGWRKEQIAAHLAAALLISEEDLLAEMNRRPEGFFFSDFLPLEATAEGFMFPDTYSFDPEIAAADVVGAMLRNFDSRLTEELVIGFLAQNLSIYEAVTLASIIEREAVVSDERPLIAGVFLNRLEMGMKLETDPTVQYAVGLQPDGAWWKKSLTYDDLAYSSPYNTYQVNGLPPGPIANPGMDSLLAVASPEETPFIFFRARCDGSGRHLFAVTYEEHLQNACSP